MVDERHLKRIVSLSDECLHRFNDFIDRPRPSDLKNLCGLDITIKGLVSLIGLASDFFDLPVLSPVSFSSLMPGDFIFYEGEFLSESVRLSLLKPENNILYAEVFLGVGEHTLGDRWNKGLPRVFPSFRNYQSNSFILKKIHFRSLNRNALPTLFSAIPESLAISPAPPLTTPNLLMVVQDEHPNEAEYYASQSPTSTSSKIPFFPLIEDSDISSNNNNHQGVMTVTGTSPSPPLVRSMTPSLPPMTGRRRSTVSCAPSASGLNKLSFRQSSSLRCLYVGQGNNSQLIMKMLAARGFNRKVWMGTSLISSSTPSMTLSPPIRRSSPLDNQINTDNNNNKNNNNNNNNSTTTINSYHETMLSTCPTPPIPSIRRPSLPPVSCASSSEAPSLISSNVLPVKAKPLSTRQQQIMSKRINNKHSVKVKNIILPRKNWWSQRIAFSTCPTSLPSGSTLLVDDPNCVAPEIGGIFWEQTVSQIVRNYGDGLSCPSANCLVNKVRGLTILTKVGMARTVRAFAKKQEMKKNMSRSLDKMGELEIRNSVIDPLWFPESFCLPEEADSWKKAKLEDENAVWIFKPTGTNCGRGIFLITCPEDEEEALLDSHVNPGDNLPTASYPCKKENADSESSNEDDEVNCAVSPCGGIMQRYLPKPLLLGGRKFDLRLYLLIACTNPLIVYYRDGYVRRCLEKYDATSGELFGHLTNAAVQKKRANYEDEKESSIWTLQQMEDDLIAQGKVSKGWVESELRPRVMTICSQLIEMQVEQLVQTRGAFELFGFDIILDENLNVFLLEVNTNPAITTQTSVLEQAIIPTLEECFDLVFHHHHRKFAVKGTLTESAKGEKDWFTNTNKLLITNSKRRLSLPNSNQPNSNSILSATSNVISRPNSKNTSLVTYNGLTSDNIDSSVSIHDPTSIIASKPYSHKFSSSIPPTNNNIEPLTVKPIAAGGKYSSHSVSPSLPASSSGSLPVVSSSVANVTSIVANSQHDGNATTSTYNATLDNEIRSDVSGESLGLVDSTPLMFMKGTSWQPPKTAFRLIHDERIDYHFNIFESMKQFPSILTSVRRDDDTAFNKDENDDDSMCPAKKSLFSHPVQTDHKIIFNSRNLHKISISGNVSEKDKGLKGVKDKINNITTNPVNNNTVINNKSPIKLGTSSLNQKTSSATHSSNKSSTTFTSTVSNISNSNKAISAIVSLPKPKLNASKPSNLHITTSNSPSAAAGLVSVKSSGGSSSETVVASSPTGNKRLVAASPPVVSGHSLVSTSASLRKNSTLLSNKQNNPQISSNKKPSNKPSVLTSPTSSSVLNLHIIIPQQSDAQASSSTRMVPKSSLTTNSNLKISTIIKSNGIKKPLNSLAVATASATLDVKEIPVVSSVEVNDEQAYATTTCETAAI